MAKFNLKKARQEATASEITTMGSGYHRVAITQAAEVGAQRAFNPDEAPKESIAVCFRNSHGVEIAKVITLTMSAYGTLSALLNACDDVDELEDLCGQQLDIEVEGSGNYPKIVGYYAVDDGLSGEPEIEDSPTHVFYSVEQHDADIMKGLHRQIRQAISARVRVK
jgi:hypothetical protein